jgi:hypothetical protein
MIVAQNVGTRVLETCGQAFRRGRETRAERFRRALSEHLLDDGGPLD